MFQFILKRLGQAVVVVFLVTIITFILLQSQPGGAARAALGKDATKEQLAAFDHENGYDRPIPASRVPSSSLCSPPSSPSSSRSLWGFGRR